MILVTGATGATGSALLRLLSAANVPARAMVRNSARGEALAELAGITPVVGDFDPPEGLDEALRGVERAYLVTNSTERAHDQQIAFIAAAQRAGVSHVVKLSQYAASAQSPVRFLRYHAEVETALRNSGIAWTMLRPNLFMQGVLLLAESVRQENRIYAPAGHAKISMIDVGDVAAAAFAALTGSGHEGRCHDLTGPEALTFTDVASIISEVMGREVTYCDVPGSALGTMMMSAGAPAWQVEGVMEDFEHYRREEAAAVTDGMAQATGRRGTPFRTFARSNAAAFMSEVS